MTVKLSFYGSEQSRIYCLTLTFLNVSSIVGRKARALYACKAEHDSELSFIAGTIFENGESGSELASRKEKGKNVGFLFV